jgi:hypothetical protein
MTFENPRYFANPSHQHHLHQRDPYANGHAQPPQHAHQLHRHEDDDDDYDNDHYDHSESGGVTPHHQLGFHGRPTPTHGNPSTPMRFGVARKPLYSIYSGQTKPGEMPSKSLSLQEERYRGDNNYDSLSAHEYNQFRAETASDSHLLHQTQSMPVRWESKHGAVIKGTCFPPRWKQTRSCHVCSGRFSLTHRRHHCRNCGFSVCGQHSTNRVPLPRFGLGEPQRVCDKCFLAGRHVLGMAPLGSNGSVMGGNTMSVASGSEQRYDPQPQYGRRDSFGSYPQ